MHDFFSPDGLAAWRRHLEQSAEFAAAARGWTGTLLLRETGGADSDRRTWIALTDGVLQELRAGAVDDEEAAEFVLAADLTTWRGLVDGSRDLAKAAFTGELKLERGSVMRLLPHAKAAVALLRAARGRGK